ncbi:hypothetical protein [Spirosoma harenae]
MKQILAIVALIVLSSACGSRGRCEQQAENYREQECMIKVEQRDIFGPWFQIGGKDPTNGKQQMFADLGKWYLKFEDHVAVGDTVIKRKNELVFYIHKKDTVLTFPFECDGEIIK